MDTYRCDRCGYSTRTKANLLKHFQRKTVCIASSLAAEIPVLDLIKRYERAYNEVTHDCQFCQKKFNNVSSMYRHKHICRKKTASVSNNEDLQKKVQELQEQVNMLLKKDQENVKDPTITNNISNINNTQNHTINYNVQVNSFGNESQSHISKEFMTDCLLKQNDGVMKFLAKLHFDADTPENNNIRLKSVKQNLLEYHCDGRWIPCDKNNTLDTMIRNGNKILFSHYFASFDDPVFRDRQDTISQYFTKLGEKTGNVYFQLRRDLFLMIYNNALYVLGAQH